MADAGISPIKVATKVDDKKVEEIITFYLGMFSLRDQITRNELAFQAIKAQRKAVPGLTADVNFAAADHYLFARARVSAGIISRVQMRAMTTGYEAVKVTQGEEAVRTEASSPASPPNAEVMLWGLTGADHGEADRKKYNPSAMPPNLNWAVFENIGSAGKKIADMGKSTSGGKSGY
jgi:hypothetical protein